MNLVKQRNFLLQEIKINKPNELLNKIKELLKDEDFVTQNDIYDLNYYEQIEYIKNNFSKEDIEEFHREIFNIN